MYPKWLAGFLNHQQYHVLLPPLDLIGIMSLIPGMDWGWVNFSRFSRLASVRELVGQDDQSGVWHQLWSSSLDITSRVKFLLDFLWHFLGHLEPERHNLTEMIQNRVILIRKKTSDIGAWKHPKKSLDLKRNCWGSNLLWLTWLKV